MRILQHHFWHPSFFGPWNQNVKSFSLCGRLGPLETPELSGFWECASKFSTWQYFVVLLFFGPFSACATWQ